MFSSSEDTLVLETKKIEGCGLFNIGTSILAFIDTSEWENILEWYDFQFYYPDNLKNIKVGLFKIMNNPFRYYDKINHDTIQLNTSKQENTLGIVTGTIDSLEVFIVDQNNNKNFCDDTVRTFNDWDKKSKKNIIKCKYIVEKKEETITDSGWIKIKKSKGITFKSTCQHLEANFFIDDIPYTMGVIDENGTSFCFYKPVFALLGENGILRDTLLERDILNLGEYIKLGEFYYKIEDFFSGSGTIELAKIKDFENKVGVQVGTIAPAFRFVSTNGDTINNSDYKNHYLLIANVSGCVPSSYAVFNEIQNATTDKLKIIGINSGISKNLKGILIDVNNPFNNEIYENFRNGYSSYDCYLVNKEGRIEDKFGIFDWKSHLNKFVVK